MVAKGLPAKEIAKHVHDALTGYFDMMEPSDIRINGSVIEARLGENDDDWYKIEIKRLRT